MEKFDYSDIARTNVKYDGARPWDCQYLQAILVVGYVFLFANCRNILLVNSSPTTYNVEDYRYTYLLSKDGRSNTQVVPLLTYNKIEK